MESFSSKWVVRSEFQCVCVYIYYFSYKNFSFKVETTKLSLKSCCPAISDCYGDQPVFM